MSVEAASELGSIVDTLGPDEVRVLTAIARRLKI